MTVEEFLDLCLLNGWHFTHSWTLKRYKALTKELKP